VSCWGNSVYHRQKMQMTAGSKKSTCRPPRHGEIRRRDQIHRPITALRLGGEKHTWYTQEQAHRLVACEARHDVHLEESARIPSVPEQYRSHTERPWSGGTIKTSSVLQALVHAAMTKGKAEVAARPKRWGPEKCYTRIQAVYMPQHWRSEISRILAHRSAPTSIELRL